MAQRFDFDRRHDGPFELVPVDGATDPVPERYRAKLFIHTVHDGDVIPRRFREDAQGSPLVSHDGLERAHIRERDWGANLVARETEIFKNQVLESGKPENIADKIVSGKLDKYFSEVTLMEQKFVKNPDLTIQDLLNEIVAKIGENISIKRFARFQVGV